MDPRHVSLRALEVLRTVAEAGSMARAARVMHMTGPGITQQIQQLERVVGAPVFDRIGRRLKLTVAGERVLAAATDVHVRISHLAKEMDALKKADDGTLHLGILATGTHILPSLLADFRQRLPGVSVHMAVSSREELSRRLLEGEVDLALMGRGPEAKQDSVLLPTVHKVAIEAGVTDGWYKYVGLRGAVVGLDRFGESAPAGQLFKEFGFTVENVVATVKRLI